MTEMTNSAARTGSTRAAIPASLRSRRRARLAAPTAILAVTGVALGGIFVPGLFVQGEDHGAQNLQQASLADIAQAQAQEFDLKTASAEAAPNEAAAVNRDSIEVAVETPAPAATQTSNSNGNSSTYQPSGEMPQYSPGSLKAQAASMIGSYGWGPEQMQCLDDLWEKESNWNPYAENPSSGAYGIPQSYPGEKMASVGADWRTNPTTQMTWGMNYIKDKYGKPCTALGQHAGSY